jgi:DNA invertase Pin-like site-specific DNA recombinase
MIFNLMALVAENERMRNIERIHQGIACARAKGKQVGRPRKIDDSKIERLKQIYQQNTLSISEICLMYDISRPTLYKYLKNTEPRIKHENLRSTRHV